MMTSSGTRMITVKIKVSQIVWDFFEGEETILPTLLHIDDPDFIGYVKDMTGRELEDEVVDWVNEDVPNASVLRLRAEWVNA